MSGPDLTAEWLACADLHSGQIAALDRHDVDPDSIAAAGGMGWTRVSVTGGLYTPSQTGDVSLILPVWNGPAPTVRQPVERPELVDLLAFRLDDPTRWSRRLRICGAVLGREYLDAAHDETLPLILFTTPLAWLRGGCRGTVLVDECETAWEARREAEAMRDAAERWGGHAA